MFPLLFILIKFTGDKMGLRNMHLLSEGHKIRLRKQLIAGARNYNKYLVNKTFKIICDDGTEINIRFFVSDFKHLTGLYSNLNDEDFYKHCVSGTIDVGNIGTNQKYNWNTLRTKGNHIEKIHELLYKDGNKTLLLEALDTRTFVFPYAVKNVANNMCVGFVSNTNRARSLRKASTSIKFQSEKHITAIFAKSQGRLKYHELVYVSNVTDTYEKNEGLLDKMDGMILAKFLEIVTRP